MRVDRPLAGPGDRRFVVRSAQSFGATLPHRDSVDLPNLRANVWMACAFDGQ